MSQNEAFLNLSSIEYKLARPELSVFKKYINLTWTWPGVLRHFNPLRLLVIAGVGVNIVVVSVTDKEVVDSTSEVVVIVAIVVLLK